jgi:hypothetical protein
MAERTSGYPTSGNGASSFHLWWDPAPVCSAVEVTLTVEWEPPVDRLCFWALQASFSDGTRRTGGAHLGLQWNPRYPGWRAVNWGGYSAAGSILDGTVSPLPSAPNDRNTRNYPWEPGAAYRLRIEPAEPGWWAGVITDPDGVRTEVRQLAGGGDRLEAPAVWSELFARCDDASVAVTWSDPVMEVGAMWGRPERYRVNYQAVENGGCSNTTVLAVDGGVMQISSTERLVDQDDTVPVG